MRDMNLINLILKLYLMSVAKGSFMNMKLFSMPLMLMLIVLSACSKKSLTELAENENQNSSNGGNGSNNGNNGNNGSNGSNNQTSYMFLMNSDSQMNSQPGTIVRFNKSTEQYDLVYDDSLDRKMDNNIADTSSNYRLPGIVHNSESVRGSYLILGDINDQNFTHYQIGFFNEQDSSLSVLNLGFTNREIAYSGHYAMLTATDGFNYVINPTGYQAVDNLINLDGATESLKLTSSYFPIGKGKFIANSIPQNSSVSNKIILFSADSSQQSIKVDTDHFIYQVLGFTEESVIFMTKNTAGDQSLYYYRYADNYLNKFYTALANSGSVKISEKIAKDENGNYYILVRNSTLQIHHLYQVSNSTGVMTEKASQSATGLSTSLFDCDAAGFDRYNSFSFGSAIVNNNKLYTTCKKTSTEKIVIEVDFTQQQFNLFIYPTTNNIGDVFSYKGENYIKSGNNTKLFTISNNTLNLSSTNQGQIYSEAQDICTVDLPNGYNCTNIQFLGAGIFPGDYRIKPSTRTVIFSITDGANPLTYLMVTDGVSDPLKINMQNIITGYGKLLDQFYLQSMFESL